MAFDNLKIEYINFRRDMMAFPPKSPMRIKIEQRMSDWLEEVKKTHGQETVDRITEKQPKKRKNKFEKKPKIQQTPRKPENFTLVPCPTCGVVIGGAKRLRKHLKKQHKKV